MAFLSSLTDDFSAGSINGTNWTLSTINGYTFSGSAAAVSGQLKVVLEANIQAYCGVSSANSYSADIAYARLIQVPNNAVGVVADLQIHKPGFRTAAQIVADTSLSSEADIIGNYTGWQRFPVITTPSPKGDSIASWWTFERPLYQWEMNNWFTLYEGSGNAATNTRVELKNLRSYIYRHDNREWYSWDVQENFSASGSVGHWTFPFNGGGAVTAGAKRSEPSGGTSFKPVYDFFYHGYGNVPKTFSNTAQADNVRGVMVAMDFRLVLSASAGPDDRDSAVYLMDVGADYYATTAMAMWSPGYAPGVGNGRYLKAAKEWKTATMWVINDYDYPTATVGELTANPPPLEAHTAGSCAFWSYENNNIYAYARADGYEELKWSAAYDTAAHAWFRIKNDGTNLIYDTAPTSASNPPLSADWVNRATTPLPWQSNAIRAFVGGGTWSVNATPGTVIWDGFNTSAGETVAASSGAASYFCFYRFMY